jgi:hypothetical protein
MIDLAQVQRDLAAASTELDRLTSTNPGTAWRWSIPANPTRDSDLLLSSAIEHIPALVAELTEARVELAELATRRIQMQLATRDLETALAAEHDILNGRPILDATQERDTSMQTALAALRGETSA